MAASGMAATALERAAFRAALPAPLALHSRRAAAAIASVPAGTTIPAPAALREGLAALAAAVETARRRVGARRGLARGLGVVFAAAAPGANAASRGFNGGGQSGQTFAQGGRGGDRGSRWNDNSRGQWNGDRNAWNGDRNGGRGVNRGDWNGRTWQGQNYRRAYSAQRRFNAGSYYRPSGWYYRRWSYGQILPYLFYSQNYWLNDYGYYGLSYPPPGCEWVRYGDDAILVDTDTGEIIQVVYGIFY